MKKYGKISVLLAIALVLSVPGFGGCGKADRENETGSTNQKMTADIQSSEAESAAQSSEDSEYRKVTSESGGEAYFGADTTVILDGQTFDIRDREDAVNAIFDIQALDGYWLVHGHISPYVGYYGFYNRETLQWEKEFLGAPLTWYRADDADAEIPFSIDTVVYAFWNDIYDSSGTLIQTIKPDESEWEYIHKLKRTDTGVEVYLLNAAMDERMVLVKDRRLELE